MNSRTKALANLKTAKDMKLVEELRKEMDGNIKIGLSTLDIQKTRNPVEISLASECILPQEPKQLVYNSGLIRRKFESLRFRGKNKVEPMELLTTYKPKKVTGEIVKLNPELVAVSIPSVHKTMLRGNNIFPSDAPDVGLPDGQSRLQPSSFLPSNGDTSLSYSSSDMEFWEGLGAEYNFNGHAIVSSEEEVPIHDERLPNTPPLSERKANVRAWILAGYKRRRHRNPFLPVHQPLEKKASAALLLEPVRKSSDIISWLSGTSDFSLSITSDPVSCEEEIQEQPVSSLSTWTGVEGEILTNDHSDSLSIVTRRFSDSDDEESLNGNGNGCFSFIRKRCQTWRRAIRARLDHLGLGLRSSSNLPSDTNSNAEPGPQSLPATQREPRMLLERLRQGKARSGIRRRNKMDKLVVGPTLSISAERLNDLVSRGLLTVEEAKAISGEPDKC